MGQYFHPVFLDTADAIVAALDPSDYGSGLTLAGHGRADTTLMCAVHTLQGLAGGLRSVRAGDDAGDGLVTKSAAPGSLWSMATVPLLHVPDDIGACCGSRWPRWRISEIADRLMEIFSWR